MLGFADAEKYFDDKSKVVVTGTPTKVRGESFTAQQKEKILSELGLSSNKKTVLVFGGSQGAKAINDAMIELIKTKKNADYQIIWSVGQKQYSIIKEEFSTNGVNVDKIENSCLLFTSKFVILEFNFSLSILFNNSFAFSIFFE